MGGRFTASLSSTGPLSSWRRDQEGRGEIQSLGDFSLEVTDRTEDFKMDLEMMFVPNTCVNIQQRIINCLFEIYKCFCLIPAAFHIFHFFLLTVR